MDIFEWGIVSAFFIAAFSSLITIMNPLSTVSVFMGLTEDKTKDEKIRIAKRSTLLAAIILIAFGFMGNFILSFFSITLDAFRLAGGLLVAKVGLDMIKGSGKNRPPLVQFSYHPHSPVIDEPVTFNSNSTDPDGFITREEWFINDVKVGRGHNFTYLFDKAGTYNVLLKVTDNKGATENTVKQIIVLDEHEDEAPVAEFTADIKAPKIKEKVTFRSKSFDPDGFITTEEWFINGELEKKYRGPNSVLEKTFKTPGIYNVVLRVTDNKKNRRKYFKQIIVADEKKEMTHNNDEVDDIAIIPLAIPMLSGPGSITTALMLMSEATNILMTASVVIAVLLVCWISYWLLVNADKVNKVIGRTSKKIIEKLLGLIVLVVGVQFFINGVTNLLILWGI